MGVAFCSELPGLLQHLQPLSTFYYPHSPIDLLNSVLILRSVTVARR